MIDNPSELQAQMKRHAAASNKYIQQRLQELVALDAVSALYVTKAVIDLATMLGNLAVPPDVYTANALEILGSAILHADKEVGVPDACKLVRAAGAAYDEAATRVKVEKDNDPWV